MKLQRCAVHHLFKGGCNPAGWASVERNEEDRHRVLEIEGKVARDFALIRPAGSPAKRKSNELPGFVREVCPMVRHEVVDNHRPGFGLGLGFLRNLVRKFHEQHGPPDDSSEIASGDPVRAIETAFTPAADHADEIGGQLDAMMLLEGRDFLLGIRISRPLFEGDPFGRIERDELVVLFHGCVFHRC